MSQRRRIAYRAGRRAEVLAALILRAKGYRILARDYRTPVGEIDIIARRGNLLAIVEVKARSGLRESLVAVTRRQQRRIEKTANLYLSLQPKLAKLNMRFDVMVVRPWRLPLHIKDAWRPEPAR